MLDEPFSSLIACFNRSLRLANDKMISDLHKYRVSVKKYSF